MGKKYSNYAGGNILQPISRNARNVRVQSIPHSLHCIYYISSFCFSPGSPVRLCRGCISIRNLVVPGTHEHESVNKNSPTTHSKVRYLARRRKKGINASRFVARCKLVSGGDCRVMMDEGRGNMAHGVSFFSPSLRTCLNFAERRTEYGSGPGSSFRFPFFPCRRANTVHVLFGRRVVCRLFHSFHFLTCAPYAPNPNPVKSRPRWPRIERKVPVLSDEDKKEADAASVMWPPQSDGMSTPTTTRKRLGRRRENGAPSAQRHRAAAGRLWRCRSYSRRPPRSCHIQRPGGSASADARVRINRKGPMRCRSSRVGSRQGQSAFTLIRDYQCGMLNKEFCPLHCTVKRTRANFTSRVSFAKCRADLQSKEKENVESRGVGSSRSYSSTNGWRQQYIVKTNRRAKRQKLWIGR
jgi:hypothetical protein